MFPGKGLDPKQLEKMMKQFGIKTEEVRAKKAVFELEDGKKIIIANPSITAMTVQGKKTYTVMGQEKQEQPGIPEEDIEMVAEQANTTKEKAKQALEKNDGDIAKAILELKK